MTKKNNTTPPAPKTKPVYDYDAIIIGSGPGGEGASMNLSKRGQRVAVIERHSDVGGGCTHWGTIPSKALRHSVSRLIDFNNNPLFVEGFHKPRTWTFDQILKQAASVVTKQTRMRTGFYNRNDVNVFHGNAEFVDNHTIKVVSESGIETITADKILVASGSRPYRPQNIDFDHPRVYDSDTILSLTHHPRHIIIYGAGVIGCEYASIFRGLDCKVTLIDSRERLLSFLDVEISDALSYHLRSSGVMIRHNETYASVEGTDDGVVVQFESGKRLKADALLFANGRTGNTDTLQLDKVGLKANHRGQLEVNEHYQTDVDNIYAVGDVIGYPSLASAAYDQGRIAADAMVDGKAEAKLIGNIPTGIYTIPEISSVGKTEQELTAAKVPYEIGQAHFSSLARAQIANAGVGCLKLLFHRETKQILGIHCFGVNASEILHIGQAIMEQEGEANTIEYFIRTTFNYPTMAEAYRVAALNGLNRLF
ncbi:Si-specific NAD(P)(+) transhydrogenase [Corallincola platygyrae]|uniref:Soluble pyridine nucleotide transhydrogenase n=1 Tax=Corallincola platygyrae TaxID=1193278 RepID=A0ABW4XMS7_9GAMM